MKLLTLVILVVVLGLLFYTAQTFHVLQIVGKHSITFFQDVYRDLREYRERDRDIQPDRG